MKCCIWDKDGECERKAIKTGEIGIEDCSFVIKICKVHYLRGYARRYGVLR